MKTERDASYNSYQAMGRPEYTTPVARAKLIQAVSTELLPYADRIKNYGGTIRHYFVRRPGADRDGYEIRIDLDDFDRDELLHRVITLRAILLSDDNLKVVRSSLELGLRESRFGHEYRLGLIIYRDWPDLQNLTLMEKEKRGGDQELWGRNIYQANEGALTAEFERHQKLAQELIERLPNPSAYMAKKAVRLPSGSRCQAVVIQVSGVTPAEAKQNLEALQTELAQTEITPTMAEMDEIYRPQAVYDAQRVFKGILVMIYCDVISQKELRRHHGAN